MRIIVSLILAVACSGPIYAGATAMDLSEAIKKEIVTVDAVNKGNYIGRSVTLTITNNSNNTVEIKVTQGTLLKPGNPAFQQLIIANDETLTIKAHEKATTEPETFCGNADKACPISMLHYSFLSAGDAQLIKVLDFIKEHTLYDQLGQAAVWAITDHHPLNNVYDAKKDAVSKKLITLLAEITKRPEPKYYTVHTANETQGQPAYLAKTEKVYIPFDADLTVQTMLTVTVLNAKNQPIKTSIDHRTYEAGKHALVAEMDASDAPAGKYKARLFDTGKMLQEKEIMIE